MDVKTVFWLFFFLLLFIFLPMPLLIFSNFLYHYHLSNLAGYLSILNKVLNKAELNVICPFHCLFKLQHPSKIHYFFSWWQQKASWVFAFVALWFLTSSDFLTLPNTSISWKDFCFHSLNLSSVFSVVYYFLFVFFKPLYVSSSLIFP